MIPVGTSATVSFTCDDASTAIALGSGDVPVLGTPKVVALAEEAAVLSLEGALAEGMTTVGTRIAMDHLAPTPIGATVRVTATATDATDRRIEFSVEARDEDTVVARGEHTRVIVERARFSGDA